MELELGLSLVPHRNINHLGGFDLNDNVGGHGVCLDKKKRSFEEAFGKIDEDALVQTLPLLLWGGRPNDGEDDDDDDDGRKDKKRISCRLAKTGGEENQVVGWPPIKSWRKKLLHSRQPQQQQNQNRPAANNDNNNNNLRAGTLNSGRGGSNSMHVKVKMEGVAIARKVDLRRYHNYQTLTRSLIIMFAKFKELDEDDAGYALTYQDKDGDWLLAGDVPWQNFIDSVQRLEILRNGM